MRIVLHVGMPKTGTTSVQTHLAPQAALEGWVVVTDPRMGWGLVGSRPNPGPDDEYQYGYDGWRNLGVVAEALDAPVFVSAEHLSAAPLARIELLAKGLRNHDVEIVVSWVPLGLALRRWCAERFAHVNAHGRIANVRSDDPWEEVETWANAVSWSGPEPELEGMVVRPDIVQERWNRAFPGKVRLVGAYLFDTVECVGKILNLRHRFDETVRMNSRLVDEPATMPTPDWVTRAEADMEHALRQQTIAQHLMPPMVALERAKKTFEEAQAKLHADIKAGAMFVQPPIPRRRVGVCAAGFSGCDMHEPHTHVFQGL